MDAEETGRAQMKADAAHLAYRGTEELRARLTEDLDGVTARSRHVVLLDGLVQGGLAQHEAANGYPQTQEPRHGRRQSADRRHTRHEGGKTTARFFSSNYM